MRAVSKPILTLLLLIVLLSYCGKGILNVETPSSKAEAKNRFLLLKERGDRQFARMYWAGWHGAISHYEEALGIRDDGDIRQRLFDALLLIAIREKSFGVKNAEYLERAAQLLPEIDSPVNRIHLKLAGEILSGSQIYEQYRPPRRTGDYDQFLQEVETLRANKSTDYHYYLYIQYLGLHARSREYKKFVKEREEFSRLYPDSNLRFFIQGGVTEIDIEAVVNQYPDFIELLLLQADRLYNQKKFLSAEEQYRRILQVNPRLPAAHTGLGSIRFWLEFYEDALPFYDEALKICPYYPKALFGKAVSLHYIGSYDLSNRVLDIMVEKQDFYHGEAHYFKAVNHYHLKKLDQIENHIRIAETYIPDSIELNAFAGIYYYHLKEIEKAKTYFEKVLERQDKNADAYYYLGLIDIRQTGGTGALDHFDKAARYFLRDLQIMENNLDRVEELNISETDKGKRKLKIIRRLKDLTQKYRQYGRNIRLIYKDRTSRKLTDIRKQLTQLEQH